MQAISFEIGGKFGFFHWGKTKGDRRVTNIFISRTEVLGILGAIVGLDGYSQRNFRVKNKSDIKETFYESLGGLNVSIIPKQVPSFFTDHLIHRSMKHINLKGSLMVEMEGLVEPSYKIVLSQGLVDNKTFEKVMMYLKRGWAEYIPYFGKNGFPVEISNVKEEQLLNLEENQEYVVDSLYKQSNVNKMPKVLKSKLINLENNDYHYSENLKDFCEEEPPKIINKQTIWSSFKVTLNSKVYETEEKEKIVFL